ncbi:MAG: hypothetical protein IJC49_03250 [Clostridia bacterium]|nr:hypothetical protein [Clostridia bacterium]
MAQQRRRIHPVLMVIIWALALVLITVIIVLALGYRYTSDNGIRFVGKVQDGQPWSGSLSYPSGITATLDKANNTITYENGDVYVGEIDVLCRDGKGTMTYANGDKYEGQWRNDKVDGEGTFYYANNDIYAGEFVAGVRHGQGVMHWANGDVYEGSFANNTMDGYGKYTWAGGNTYEGYYQKDARHGEGILVIRSGESMSRYEGEWINDKKQGNGVQEYDNGDRYSGKFIAGLPDTRVTDENGNFVLMEDGRYEHGSEAIYTYASGRQFTGYFEAGKQITVDNGETPADPPAPETSTEG